MKTPLILFSFSSASLAGDSRRRTRISTSSKSIKRSPDRLKSWTSTDLKNEDPCLYFSMLSQPQSGAVRSHVHEQHAVRQLVLKLSKLKSHESDAGVANSTQVSFMCRHPRSTRHTRKTRIFQLEFQKMAGYFSQLGTKHRFHLGSYRKLSGWTCGRPSAPHTQALRFPDGCFLAARCEALDTCSQSQAPSWPLSKGAAPPCGGTSIFQLEFGNRRIAIKE